MSKEESTPYSFKGDNAKLVDSIKSLLALDSKGALVPNGVCGLARQLLESAVERLSDDAQPVAGQSRFTSQKDWQPCSYEHHLMVIASPGEWPGYETRALFTRSDAGEAERLKQEILVARAQGRAEAVEIIVALEAEGGLDEYIGSHTIGCTGEYGSHWKEDELRELLRADAPAASELESCRYNSYEIIHLEEERDTLLAKLAGRDAQLSKATTFVKGLCDSSGSQPSVATGYLRDILDVLQASAEPDTIAYRLLSAGDTISATDEHLGDDAATWSPVGPGIFNGMKYISGGMLPVRRAITIDEPANKESAQ